MAAQKYHSIEPAVPVAPGHDAAAPPHPQTVYYMYRDGNGRPHIVDSLGLVPPGARHVQRMVMGRPTDDAGAQPKPDPTPHLPDAMLNAVRGVIPKWMPSGQPAREVGVDELGATETGAHGDATALGVTQHLLLWMPMGGLLLAMLLLALLMRPMRRFLLRTALAMVGLSLVGSGYLTLANRRAGLRRGTPAQLIEAAQQSVQQMQESLNQERRTLDGIDKQVSGRPGR